MKSQNGANAPTGSAWLKSMIGPVARYLLGEPNTAMSKPTELRFGAHGSLSVDLERGYGTRTKTGAVAAYWN